MSEDSTRERGGMKMELVATDEDLKEALDRFRYHKGYQEVRGMAKSFFERMPGQQGITRTEGNELALVLTRVLVQWGACRGNAAGYLTPEAIGEYLEAEGFRKDGPLARLNAAKIGGRDAKEGDRGGKGRSTERLDSLVNAYMNAMEEVTRGVLTNVNSSSVYPAKVVMLLTGWGPALDSWVRAGMRTAGVPIRHSHYRFSGEDGEKDVAFIKSLMLAMDELYADCAERLDSQLDERTCDDPGRLLDVLWFQQGKGTTIFRCVE